MHRRPCASVECFLTGTSYPCIFFILFSTQITCQSKSKELFYLNPRENHFKSRFLTQFMQSILPIANYSIHNNRKKFGVSQEYFSQLIWILIAYIAKSQGTHPLLWCRSCCMCANKVNLYTYLSSFESIQVNPRFLTVSLFFQLFILVLIYCRFSSRLAVVLIFSRLTFRLGVHPWRPRDAIMKAPFDK